MLTECALPLNRRTSRRTIFLLLALTAVATLLRLVSLATTFPTGDNAVLARKILTSPGFGWMLEEPYGLMINLLVKGFAALVVIFGGTLTEFWWKLPIAVFGIMQVPLSFFFLKSLGSSDFGALSLSAFVAVLPQHVTQSRYLWGYEILGIFFLTVAVWVLLRFLILPKRRSGLAASFCSGLYLISHGYIIPFAPTVLACLLLATKQRPSLAGLLVNLVAAVKHFVWLFPLLLLPVYWISISYALSKKTQLGFYLPEHTRTFIGDTWFPIIIAFLLASLFSKLRSYEALLFALVGSFYLAPLIFGTPPSATDMNGYITIGIYSLLVAAMLIFDRLSSLKRGLALTVLGVTFVSTLMGVVDTVFWQGRIEPYRGVLNEDPEVGWPERGIAGVDPGTKAAGYLVQMYVPESARVLAAHRAIRPETFAYYFNREGTSFYYLTPNEAGRRLRERDQADVVITEEEQSSKLDKDDMFPRKTSLETNGAVRAVIFTRPGISIPRGTLNVDDLNDKFDRDIGPGLTDKLWRNFW